MYRIWNLLSCGSLLIALLWALEPQIATAQSAPSSLQSELRLMLKTAEPTAPSRLDRRASVQLEIWPAGTPHSENPETRSLEIDLPGQSTVRLAPGSLVRVRSTIDGYWTPIQEFEVEESPLAVHLSFYRAGWIGSRIQGSSSTPEKHLARLSFEPSPGRGFRLPSATVDCPIAESELRCPVPAGVFDLRLDVDGSIPGYYWDIEIPEDATRNLGTFERTAGASVIGWVEAPGSDTAFVTAQVELAPTLAGVAAPEDRDRTNLQRITTRSTTRGFFQLRGVSPGRWTLLVTSPGYARGRLELTIDEPVEIEAPSIILEKAAHLRLEIRPTTDPFRSPWIVAIERPSLVGGFSDSELRGKAEDGVWESGPLDPGEVFLRLADSRGNTWWVEQLELGSGVREERLSIPVNRFEGNLVLTGDLEGDPPLSNAVVLISENEGNAKLRVVSNDKGNFYAFVRGDATWDVEVYHYGRGIAAFFPSVELPELRRGEPWPRREFEIPDTGVWGEVVDSLGVPVTAPTMLFLYGGREPEKYSLQMPVAEGGFEIRGLPPGPLSLQARFDPTVTEREGASELTDVDLRKDLLLGPLRLELAESHRIRGVVTTPTGHGVAGTKVVALTETPEGRSFRSVPVTHTDFDGTFELAIPSAATAAQLTFFPPGFGVVQTRIDLTTNEPLVVPVASSFGTLVIRYPETGGAEPSRALRLETAVFGQYRFHEAFLDSWARSQGGGASAGQWVLPGLAAGPYQVCFGPQWRKISNAPGGRLPEDPACRSGILAPGAELVLELATTTTQ